jgi:hypothetical protein
MHSNLFGGDRFAVRCRSVSMFDDKLADRITAQGETRWSRKECVVRFPAALFESLSQDGHGVAGERGDALLAPFAIDPHMSTVTKGNVDTAHASQLGHP